MADIFKQTIAGHSMQDIIDCLCAPAGRVEGIHKLRGVWTAFAQVMEQHAPAYIPAHTTGPQAPEIPVIRHSDKIEVKCISDDFAEVSETTWQKLKGELFGAGLDDNDVRLIARSLAKGETASHGGGAAPMYEYRKVLSP